MLMLLHAPKIEMKSFKFIEELKEKHNVKIDPFFLILATLI